MLAIHDLALDPQLVAQGFWARQERRYVGVHLTPQPPFRFDGLRPALTRPAPVLGEHTHEVLSQILHLSASDIASLESAKII